MGLCYSCCGESNAAQGNESSERTHLLTDPISGSSSSLTRVQSDGDYSSRSSSALPRKDEQSALNRILHQTATNVIDVGALDIHDLEQHEYYERMKAYGARLNGLLRWSPPAKPGLILIDVPSPLQHLAAEPISPETLILISTAVDNLTEAVAQIKVAHKEDVVVPFRIP